MRGIWLSWLSVPGWQTIREVDERSARLFEALAHGPEPINHEEQQYDLGQEDHEAVGLPSRSLQPPFSWVLLRKLAVGRYAERWPDRQALGVRPDQPRKARVKALASE